jgi:hypothetical protein
MTVCIQALALVVLWVLVFWVYRHNLRKLPRLTDEVERLAAQVPRGRYHYRYDIGAVPHGGTTYTRYPVFDPSVTERERQLTFEYEQREHELHTRKLLCSWVFLLAACVVSALVIFLPWM